MKTTIYHNPRCGKSRQTLALLREHGIEPIVIEYLKNPPTYQELDSLLQKLAMQPRQLMRTQQSEYKAYQLDNSLLNREALIEAMITHPILIERPIVVMAEKAIIGRPPEAILPLLTDNLL